MSTLENLVSSPIFLVIIILVLIVLIALFVYIVFSNQNADKKRKERKRDIDETQQIKIIDNGSHDVFKEEPKEEELETPSRKEIAIIEDETIEEIKEEIKEDIPENIKEEVFDQEEPIIDEEIEDLKTMQEFSKVESDNVFDLPNFDDIDADLEKKIIEEANKYVESIMRNEE